LSVFCQYTSSMKKKTGRPKKSPSKSLSRTLQFRLTDAEKQAFSEAAELCGQEVSVWIRAQLRQAARSVLEENGQSVAFSATKFSETE
jgi:uncharacterized protein (DUF1778 family)